MIEIMKDRESKIERDRYNKSGGNLEKIGGLWYNKRGTRLLSTKDCSKQMNFKTFCSASNYDRGVKGVPSIDTFLNKPHTKDKSILALKESPFAKWIMLLQEMKVTLRKVTAKTPITHEKKKERGVSINKEIYALWLERKWKERK